MLTLPLIYGPQSNRSYRVCVWGGGVSLDQDWPPVVNPDPIGHDSQSAAEILNENSSTNSLTPPKWPCMSFSMTRKKYQNKKRRLFII